MARRFSDGLAVADCADLDHISANHEVLAADARYRTLAEQIPAVVFMLPLDDPNSDSYVGHQIESVLGFSQSEWLNNPILWYQHIHAADKERWSVESAQFIMSGEPLRSTYRVIARDGHVVWLWCEAKMVGRSDGNPWFGLKLTWRVDPLVPTIESAWN